MSSYAVPLCEAVRRRDFEKLENIMSVTKIDRENLDDYKLLVEAFKTEDKEIIKFLLHNDCRVQHPSDDRFSKSPLYFALSLRDTEILEFILKKVSLDRFDHKKDSVFGAITRASREEIRLILTAYVEQNLKPSDYDGSMPYHLACYIGDVDLVKKFIDLGCDPDSRLHPHVNFYAGWSALHFAVRSKCSNTVKLLLQNCRDIKARDSQGRSPFRLACQNKSERIMNLFFKSYVEKHIQCDEDETFALLLDYLNFGDRSASFNWKIWSMLHIAVARQRIELVEVVLEKYCRDAVISADGSDLTPLHLACQCCFKRLSDSTFGFKETVEIVRMLLEKGSDPNALDRYGKTPLFYVLETFQKLAPHTITEHTRQRFIEVRFQLINMLLHYGAKVNVVDVQLTTLLHLLSDSDLVFYERDKLKIAERFLELGADVNARDRYDRTPMYLAIRNKLLELAKLYVNSNADVNVACRYNNLFTPLHALPYYNDYSSESNCLMGQMLEKGANVNSLDMDDATPLHLAIQCHGKEGEISDNRDKMVETLIAYGANVNAPDRFRQTPLQRACFYRYNEGAIVLLENGADVNIEDHLHRTSIHYAIVNPRESNDAPFLLTMRRHVWALFYIDGKVTQKTWLDLASLEFFCETEFPIPPIRTLIIECTEELKRMKAYRLDSCTTLRDILFASTNKLLTVVNNDNLLNIIRTEKYKTDFKIYGYLLRLQYLRGLKKKELVDSAINPFKALVKYALPDVPIMAILTYVDDWGLANIIESQKLV